MESYVKYKNQRKLVKDMIVQEKEQTWEEFGKRMEIDTQGYQKLFYNTLKTVRIGNENNNI